LLNQLWIRSTQKRQGHTCHFLMQCLANCDSSVHNSEESSNAATAVPWAIVSRESHIHGANTKCIRSVPLASQDSSGGVSIHIHLLKLLSRLLPCSNQCLSCILHGQRLRIRGYKPDRAAHGPDFLQQFWSDWNTCINMGYRCARPVSEHSIYSLHYD
jgi:hypothetical protein